MVSFNQKRNNLSDFIPLRSER